MLFNGSATCSKSSEEYRSCSEARDSRVVSCVVHVVREALSNDPGVKVGVSPTLRLLDFLAFFSKYLLAKLYSLPLYSFSIALRSR